jgi:hypothetical protein
MSDFETVAADLKLIAYRADVAVQSVLMASASSMASEMAANSPSRRVAASVRVDRERKNGVVVGPTHPLSHLFEFGTGPRVQHSTGRYTGIMSPRPYVWPAVDRELPNMYRNIGSALGLL